MSKKKGNKLKVPEGWKYVPFGDVFEFLPTIALSREQLTLEKAENIIYNIHYGDIHATYNSNILDFEKEKRVPRIIGEIEIKTSMLLKDGDLAIADASEDYEGVASSVELVNINKKKVTGGLHTFVARDNSGLTEKGFRSYVLKNPIVANELKKLATGSKVYGISKTNLASLHILLPNNAEQKKISKIFHTHDAVIETLNTLIQKKQRNKIALMQQILTGKRRFKEFKKEKWETIRLGKLCSAILDGTHQTPTYTSEGIPFYSVESITKGDFKNTKFISEADHIEMSKRCKLLRDDILLTRIGSIGDTVIVDWNVNASIYVSLALIRVNADLYDPYFVYQYTKSDQFKKEILKRSLLLAAPQKINLGEIQDIEMFVPLNKKEQTRIASVLQSADKEIETLKSQLEHCKWQKNGLIQTLLTGEKRVKV